jgi:hypothetical protein
MRANRIISTVALNPFLVSAQTYWASCYYRVSCGDWQGGGWGNGVVVGAGFPLAQGAGGRRIKSQVEPTGASEFLAELELL